MQVIGVQLGFSFTKSGYGTSGKYTGVCDKKSGNLRCLVQGVLELYRGFVGKLLDVLVKVLWASAGLQGLGLRFQNQGKTFRAQGYEGFSLNTVHDGSGTWA